jgi:salicylate hydroxylase
MFPTTGQGACQSLEDAAALGILLSELRCKTDLPMRLQIFQRLRHERVMAVHAMSSVLVGQETQMSEKVARLLPGGKLFSGHMEHFDFTHTYVNVLFMNIRAD